MNSPTCTNQQKRKNIIIFGCGDSGLATFNRIKTIRRINIIGFTDNNPNKWDNILMEKPVLPVHVALDGRADLILIASEWHEEIYNQLIRLQIDPKLIKVVPTRIRRANSFGKGPRLQLAESVLIELSIFFKNRSIKYYLHGGTLLGAVREKRLLPRDYDLDVLIDPLHKDNLEDIASDFARHLEEKTGHSVNIEPHFYTGNWDEMPQKTPSRLFLLCIDSANKCQIPLDLYKTVDHNEKYVWSLEDQIFHAPKTQFKTGAKINFLNQDFMVPAEFKEFLTTLYGDWSKPLKNWDPKFQKNGATSL